MTLEERVQRLEDIQEITYLLGKYFNNLDIDSDHARGVFQYEDHMCYFDDAETCEGWAVYCEDFVNENGVWRISRHRMAYRQMDGFYRDPIPPESWVPEDWEEPTY